MRWFLIALFALTLSSLNGMAAPIEQLYDTVQTLNIKLQTTQDPKERAFLANQLEFARGMYVAQALLVK